MSGFLGRPFPQRPKVSAKGGRPRRGPGCRSSRAAAARAGWREPVTLVAVAAGLLIGASLGALGGGGSILTVPALVYLLGQSPHRATTASLMVVGTAAIAGA